MPYFAYAYVYVESIEVGLEVERSLVVSGVVELLEI